MVNHGTTHRGVPSRYFSPGRLLCLALILFTIIALVAVPVLAHVKDWYEWPVDPATGKPKRTLKVWVDPAAGAQLKEWTQQAMDNWNNAQTGWTLQPTDQIEGADVTVHSAPIPNNPDGSDPVGRCQSDFDPRTGEVIGATITLDSTENWGTTGAGTLDPVKVLKHELGHAMRLTHSELGNLMEDSIAEGDHDRTPNADDIDEAKQSFSSTRPVPEPRTEGEKTGLRSGSADLRLTTEDYNNVLMELDVPVTVYPIEGVMLLDPLAVPDGLERIVVAAGIFPLTAEFSQPAHLNLTWEQGAIDGLVTVGELHRHPQPQVDPALMVPVCWVADPAHPGYGEWIPAAVEMALDVKAGTASLTVRGGGIYGLAAPAEHQPSAEGRPAFMDVTASTESLTAQALTELRAMDIYRGYPDQTAQPGRKLTRLEFFTIAVRLAGGEAAAQSLAGTRPDFTDAIPAWGWGYVNQAAAMGLARGYPDGSFRPLQDVTGYEALAVLVRVLGPEGETVARARPWPQGYFAAAMELGLLDDIAEVVEEGLTDWLPGHINRGEMAVLTRAAVWTEARYDTGGNVVGSASAAVSCHWWRQTVRLVGMSADGRRWSLAQPVQIPGSGRTDRLDVDQHPYLAPGSDLPQVGRTVTVFGLGKTVLAIMAVEDL